MKLSFLKYRRAVFVCTHGGKKRKRGNGIRPVQHYNCLECPARLVLCADLKTCSLVVKDFDGKHNHVTDEAAFMWYPKNRRLSNEDKATVLSLNKLHVRAADIRSTLSKSSGKSVLTKDIHNICAGIVVSSIMAHDVLICY